MKNITDVPILGIVTVKGGQKKIGKKIWTNKEKKMARSLRQVQKKSSPWYSGVVLYYYDDHCTLNRREGRTERQHWG